MAILDKIKSLFGKDTSPTERKQIVGLDLITPDNVPEGALAALWEKEDARYRKTIERIREVRAAMAGETRPAMAEEWDMADREALRAGGPEPQVLPRDVARRLASKESEIKRPVSSLTPTESAVSDASDIERWANSYCDEEYPDVEIVEMLTNEAETLMLQIPTPSSWCEIPTLWDEAEAEGEFTSQDDYAALPANRQKEYAVGRIDGGQKQYKRVSKAYRLNSDGQPDDGSEAFTIDFTVAKKSHAADMEMAYANNFPIESRGPISRLDFVPLNPIFKGKRVELDGVIIRTLYRRSKLLRDYRWTGCQELLSPVDRYEGIDGDFWLYELWAYDEEHRPFVAYQVGKSGTQWANSGDTAVIKLWEEYPGVNELPICFEYGQHTAASNPDLRTLPFPTPYLQNWSQRDGILTAMAISAAEAGYPTWGQKITPDAIEAMNSLEGDYDLEFRMRPNTVQPVFGDLIDMTARGTNQDVKVLLQALGALNSEVLPSQGAFGGEGPTSGLDRQVLGRDMEVRFGDIIGGGQRMKQTFAKNGLMLASALGKKAGRPVDLLVAAEGVSKSGSKADARVKVSLSPDICKGTFDVIAVFPNIPGENLAASSLFLEALGQGAILLREWREKGWGDPHPEEFLAEKILEDFLVKTPAGQMQVLTAVAQALKDDHLTQMIDLVAQGKATTPLGGTSTAAMQDMLGGSGQQPGPATNTGVQYGNPAQSALAGANGGAIQASAASAGGPFAPGQAA